VNPTLGGTRLLADRASIAVEKRRRACLPQASRRTLKAPAADGGRYHSKGKGKGKGKNNGNGEIEAKMAPEGSRYKNGTLDRIERWLKRSS
jgi:hypothetical protein